MEGNYKVNHYSTCGQNHTPFMTYSWRHRKVKGGRRWMMIQWQEPTSVHEGSHLLRQREEQSKATRQDEIAGRSEKIQLVSWTLVLLAVHWRLSVSLFVSFWSVCPIFLLYYLAFSLSVILLSDCLFFMLVFVSLSVTTSLSLCLSLSCLYS